MPRSRAHLENNSFVKGLITEASPLTFPENASVDENNFVLNTDGTRDRRLGADYENGYAIHTIDQQVPAAGVLPFQTFNWENVGGDSSVELIVTQVGNKISFFDTSLSAVSANKIGGDFEVGSGAEAYDFASVDGQLIVVSNSSELEVFTYDGGTITSAGVNLKVRDLFGLEDELDIDGTVQDLYSPDFITHRPDVVGMGANDTVPPPFTITNPHLYNLRNQSWGIPRRPREDSLSGSNDPLITFAVDVRDYPSNAEVVHGGVFVDPEDSRDPPDEALFPYKLGTAALSNSAAGKGFFVIDLLNRGQSRGTAYESKCNTDTLGSSAILLGVIPLDRTPGGATAVEEFGGRVFYSGFSGEVISGDNRSPKLSSYVLFSKIVQHPSDIGICYQEGDPTDKEQPELIASDGGFIRIQGAYGVKKLVNIGSALAVVASNGVWLIQGESGLGFSATGYEVKKVTKRGCTSPSSVVVVDNSLVYWGVDGIHTIALNEVGEYGISNLSHDSIRKFYDNISSEDKATVHGVFDSFQRKVCWTYGGDLTSTEDIKQLTLDVKLGAFSPSSFSTAEGSVYPRIVGTAEVPPFIAGTTTDLVVVGGDQVQASAVDVQVSTSIREGALREVKYMTLTGTDVDGKLQLTFSALRDQDFLDWKTFDGTGQDAPAFLLTGHLTGGDSSRKKYVPNITFHFKRTEDGFQVVDSEVVATKPSSCKVQAQWDWANSAQSGKFGREFQAYRYRKHYIPEEITDPYDYGFDTIVTRNRLRGNGKSLSLLIKSEPEKDLRLIGWGQEVLVDGRE